MPAKKQKGLLTPPEGVTLSREDRLKALTRDTVLHTGGQVSINALTTFDEVGKVSSVTDSSQNGGFGWGGAPGAFKFTSTDWSVLRQQGISSHASSSLSTPAPSAPTSRVFPPPSAGRLTWADLPVVKRKRAASHTQVASLLATPNIWLRVCGHPFDRRLL